MPLVSVIMPAYHCAQTVQAAIRSVQRQTLSDWELIVVDDASADETPRILEACAKEDNRICCIRNPVNLGVSGTRNRGLDVAQGLYIAFLDSDDIWEDTKLEHQIQLLDRQKADLCYTSYDFIDLEGKPVGRSYQVPESVHYQQLLAENVVGLSTVLIRRESLRDLRFEEGWLHEDYVLWLELLRHGQTFCGLPEVLVQYRRGGRSSNKLKAAQYRWRIFRCKERLPFFTSLRYLCRYALSGWRKHT